MLVMRQFAMLSWVRVQRFVLGPDGGVKPQCAVLGDDLVIPLHDELDRGGDGACDFSEIVACEPEDRALDSCLLR